MGKVNGKAQKQITLVANTKDNTSKIRSMAWVYSLGLVEISTEGPIVMTNVTVKEL